MRARIDQREVQAALSALPLFHELLGFRFRRVSLTLLELDGWKAGLNS
jgi:hypothetical protein